MKKAKCRLPHRAAWSLKGRCQELRLLEDALDQNYGGLAYLVPYDNVLLNQENETRIKGDNYFDLIIQKKKMFKYHFHSRHYFVERYAARAKFEIRSLATQNIHNRYSVAWYKYFRMTNLIKVFQVHSSSLVHPTRAQKNFSRDFGRFWRFFDPQIKHKAISLARKRNMW
jgi:hypothetical protein